MNIFDVIEELEYNNAKLIMIRVLIIVLCSAPIIQILCKHFGVTGFDSWICSICGAILLALIIRKE